LCEAVHTHNFFDDDDEVEGDRRLRSNVFGTFAALRLGPARGKGTLTSASSTRWSSVQYSAPS
jgi:hypothetical protein